MLVLSRRLGEGVTIGEDILVKVLSRKGSRVRIGIEAPRGVKILRLECEAQEVADTVNSEEGRDAK